MDRVTELDKHTTDLTTVITPDNVQYLGENFAICALKHLIPYRGQYIEKYYFDLIRDVHCRNSASRCISDGYDFAQTAICFLCGYMGKTLGDTVIGKNGKPVTIKHACYSEVGNLVYKRIRYASKTVPIRKKDAAISPLPFEENIKEQSYDRAEEIIGKMKLTDKQSKTLEYYMEGKGVCEIARLLSVANCTVWRYRMLMRERFVMVTENYTN